MDLSAPVRFAAPEPLRLLVRPNAGSTSSSRNVGRPRVDSDHMTLRGQVWINVIGVVVLGAALGVVTNFVTDSVPAWFQDEARAWLSFTVLVLLVVLVQVLAALSAVKQELLVRAGPKFGSTPSALRRPSSNMTALHGRDVELARLLEMVASPRGRFAVVCGPGGMGKTTVASEVAERAERLGHKVFWILWRDEARFTKQVVAMAINLGLSPGEVGAVQESGGSLLDLVWGHLEVVGKWVLVVDNVDSPGDLSPDEPLWAHRGWIRPDGAGLLLVTSRDRNRDTWGRGAELVSLAPLVARDGARVLQDLAPNAGDRESAEKLAARLGGLPLALHAVGKTLVRPTGRLDTFKTYHQALSDRSADVLPLNPDVTNLQEARTLVGHTWEVSLDQLEVEGKPLARPLLRSLSLLADSPIPLGLVELGIIPSWMRDGSGRAAVEVALASLEQYGLVDVLLPESTFGIRAVVLHPLVRETNALLLRQDPSARSWAESVELHVIKEVESSVAQGREAWSVTRLLVPHLIALEGLASADDRRFTSVRDAVVSVANELEASGDTAGEIALRKHVLAAEQEKRGAEHPDTLVSQSRLAVSLSGSGHYVEAELLDRLTLDARLRVLGPNHSDTLNSQSNLAVRLGKLGFHGESEELHRRTLEARVRVLGSDHPDTLGSQNNLALTLRSLGRYVEAVELHRETLGSRQRIFGPDHPATVGSRANLAITLDSLGFHAEASELHRESFEARVRMFGTDHPDTLGSRNNLAISLHGLGRYAEAEKIHREILEVRDRIYGPDHPNTVGSQNNLAITLDRMGNYVEAEKLHRTSFRARARIFGNDHPDTINSQNDLAITLRNLGRLAEALEMDLRTREIRIRVLGPDHPDTLASMNNLAITLDSLGRHVEAEWLQRETLVARRRVLGLDHPDTLGSQNNLAMTLRNLDRYSEAVELDRRTLDARVRVLGPDHPDTLNSRMGLLAGDPMPRKVARWRSRLLRRRSGR